MNRLTGIVASLVYAGAASGTQAAQANYPIRPILFVVPFAPCGLSDVSSRLVGLTLGESLGESLVINNRSRVDNAGDVLGFELAAKSPPDGHTILLGANSGLTINPHVCRRLPFDPQCNFQPITQLTTDGNVVVVNPVATAHSVKEFQVGQGGRPEGAMNTCDRVFLSHIQDLELVEEGL